VKKVGAGWSSPVARQAHNLKVVGSNPTPAPNFSDPLVLLYCPPLGGVAFEIFQAETVRIHLGSGYAFKR
jgi:hypothetical protein